MIEYRPFDTLGGANHGRLNAKHHFSFVHYHDPKRERQYRYTAFRVQPGIVHDPHLPDLDSAQ